MIQNEHPLSWEAITRLVLMGLFLVLLWKALDAVTAIVVALVLTAAIYPVVHSFHRKTRLPVLFSTFIIFITFLTPFIFIGFSVVPNISSEIPQLVTSVDSTLTKLPLVGHMFNNFSIIDYVQSHLNYILASSGNILQTILSLITTIILTFYFVYDYERLLDLFLNIFPYKEKPKLKGFIEEISTVMGQYIRGNVIISFITFFVIYVGLLLLHVPFALPLAVFAGLFDLLPLVGSTLGAVPALLVAFSVTPTLGLLVLLLHLVYQQVENAIISPAIYNKALKLYPSLGFLSVVIGASLFGIIGAFLALPVAASIPVAVQYAKNNKTK